MSFPATLFFWPWAISPTAQTVRPKIIGLSLTTTEYYDENEDPENASRNGVSGLFGAAANGAEVSNITLENVTVDIVSTTSYNYIAPLIAFVEGCDVINCHVTGLNYHVAVSDENGMYTSLGGLISGIWVGTVQDCSVDGNMNVELITNNTHSGDNFIGGLLGDGYVGVDGNTVNVDIVVKYINNCQADYERPDGNPSGMELVYAAGFQKLLIGGLAGQSNTATNCLAKGNVTLQIESPVDNTLVACDALCGVLLDVSEAAAAGSEGTGTVNVNK